MRKSIFHEHNIPYADHVGPGYYDVSSSSLCQVQKLGGTGGFASKSSRFKMTYGRKVPGPGAYDLSENRAPPTVKIVTPKRIRSKQRSTIGPGQYEPQKPSRSLNTAMVWFKSTSKRFSELASSQSPGPGEYDTSSGISNTQAPRFTLPVYNDKVSVFGVGEGLEPMPLKIARDIDLPTLTTTPGPGTYDPMIPSSKDFSTKVGYGFAVRESGKLAQT